MAKTFNELFEERIGKTNNIQRVEFLKRDDRFMEIEDVRKYNHNHDALGRFTFSNGGSSSGGRATTIPGTRYNYQRGTFTGNGKDGEYHATNGANTEDGDNIIVENGSKTSNNKEKVQFVSHDTVKTLDPKGFNERAEQKAAELKQLQKYKDMGDIGENIEEKRAEVNKSIDITSRNLEDGYPPPLTKEPYDYEKALNESGGTEEQVNEANGYAQQIGKYWESKEEGHDKTREQEVTEAVVKASVESGGKMFGLEAREKTETSLTRKIVKDKVGGEDGTLKEIANKMKDGVRYTTVFDDDKFVDGYERTKQKLAELGYQEYRCKNFFQKDSNPVQSVQSVFGKYDEKTKTWKGLFELQFQTPSTQGAKNLSHEMYDIIRDPNTDEKTRSELTEKTRELYSFSTEPPRARDIPWRDPDDEWNVEPIVK